MSTTMTIVTGTLVFVVFVVWMVVKSIRTTETVLEDYELEVDKYEDNMDRRMSVSIGDYDS